MSPKQTHNKRVNGRKLKIEKFLLREIFMYSVIHPQLILLSSIVNLILGARVMAK